MYFCLLWPLLVLNNTCLAVGSMVVPLPTPTHRHMWSRKKRRFFSDGLGCGTSVRDAAPRGQDPAAGAAVTACRWDSSRSPRGPSGPARSSRLFLGSAPGSQLGPSSTRGRPCPVPRAVTICRGGAHPQRSAVVPGWSRGPPALLVERGHAPGGRRAGCVASTPAWEHPCLNLNTFILTANKQRTVFLRLSQSCRLSPLGSRGLAALPFLPSC